MAAQAAGRDIRRCDDRRPRQAGDRRSCGLRALAVVGRTGTAVGVLAAGDHAGGRILPDVRLAAHDRSHRRLAAARAGADHSRARSRDRRGDRGLYPRAERHLPHSRIALCGRLVDPRAALRVADRRADRDRELRTLCGLVHRLRGRSQHSDRAVLARLDSDRRRNRRVEIFIVPPDTPIVGWTETSPSLY